MLPSRDGWDDYMSTKKMKLHDQFNEQVENNSKQSDIFNGVSIFVNGYTIPPADELKRLMISYGGIYHHYYENGKTTYMIATMLPHAKITTFRNSKIKVIKPEWITDSIQAGKMLNHKPYLLLSENDNIFSKQNSDANKPVKPSIPEKSSTNERSMMETKPKTYAKTARDENFIEEFYNNSRLHHLSTMGAKLKSYVSDLRAKNITSFLGRERLKKISSRYTRRVTDTSYTNEKCIMHIDLDCFFVSVGIRNRPELEGLPVAVAHARNDDVKISEGMAKNAKIHEQLGGTTNDPIPKVYFHLENIDAFDSMSDISSCSYKAREFGIKNGMIIGQALKLCPQLKIIPYDFQAYEEVSYAFYNHLISYTLDIEAVSCDEMYVDCTELLNSSDMDAMSFATILRKEIKEITGCTCSTGFGPNPLIARLATKKAKPNGQFCIRTREIADFMKNIPISHIPGVGSSINRKLSSMGIKTCEDMQKFDVTILQQQFGKKLGHSLHRRSFGEDDKVLNFNHQRKSLSADINYGIRFQTKDDAETFLKKLSFEIEHRLKDEKLKGKSITLKFMVKSKDAPNESAKYMGHGICENITKTISLNQATSESDVIFRIATKVLRDLKIAPELIRGIGIQVSRLEKQNQSKIVQSIDKFIVKKEDSSSSPSKIDSIEDENKIQQLDIKPTSTCDNPPKRSIPQESSGVKRTPAEIFSEFSNRKYSIPLSEKVSFGSYISYNKKYPEFSTLTPISEIARAVELWISNEDYPQLSDVEMLFSFVKHLALKNDFESLNFLVDSIEKCLRNNTRTKWEMMHYAFEKFIRCINQSM